MSNTLSVKLTINGQLIDISDDVIISSVNIGERADLSFEVGSFKFKSSTIKHNIPPYTVCLISDRDFAMTYLCSSEATAYLTTNEWYHDVKLLVPEAMLECYIIGSKTFSLNDPSNTSDGAIVNKLFDLATEKYTTAGFFIENRSLDLTGFHNEYTFNDGATLYSMLREIANKNNITFNCTVWEFTYNSIVYVYVYVGFKNLSDQNRTISSDKLTNIRFIQNSQNYAKYLETEGQDIVYRDDNVKVKLTPRSSNNIFLNADSAEIILPSNAEAITKFVVNGRRSTSVSKMTHSNLTWQMVHNIAVGSETGYEFTEKHTASEWAMNDYGGTHAIWNDWYDTFITELSLWNAYFRLAVEWEDVGGTIVYGEVFAYLVASNDTTGAFGGVYTAQSDTDMSEICVESNYFDTIEASKQPKYVLYTSGSNKITNLNASYRRDFWGVIIGASVGNFLSGTSFNKNLSIESRNMSIGAYYSFENTDPRDKSFTITYTPIFNPKLIDKKNTETSEYLINESSLKEISRSYQMGKNNGFITDFKLLVNDMDKQNETLGLIECVLEADTTNLETATAIHANDQITFTYDNEEYSFYVASLNHRYSVSKRYTQYNLCKTQYKIADAIGVDYQFNSTKVPLNSTVDRKLYFETSYDLRQANNYFSIDLLDDNDNIIETWACQPLIMIKDGVQYAYIEAMDNAVFGYSVGTYISGSGNVLNACKMGDSNACFTSIRIYKENLSRGLTNGETNELPQYTAIQNIYKTKTLLVGSTKVYKDSREKISIMIKSNYS